MATMAHDLQGEWFCPLCKEQMSVTPYPNPSGKRPGFRLDCKGTDAVQHRLRIYLDGFRVDAPFLLAPKVAGTPPRNSKVRELLQRARELAA